VRFSFISKEKAHHSVRLLCEVLRVSRSGFYAWEQRAPSRRATEDARLQCHVVAAFKASGRTYGSPRLKEELEAQGIRVGRHRVARLMREGALAARKRRRFVTTTDSAHEEAVPVNLLKRDFTATRENEKWVGDITYLPTTRGFIYLAVLLDLFSRRVVGWSISASMESDLAHQALEVALATRQLAGPLIHHTDRGVQYTSRDYVRRLEAAGIQRSMSRRGDCWDNAPAESFFSSLKTELPAARKGNASPEELHQQVIDYIARYNLERRHSSIGYLAPVEYEEAARMGRAA
jgi:putative transposase